MRSQAGLSGKAQTVFSHPGVLWAGLCGLAGSPFRFPGCAGPVAKLNIWAGLQVGLPARVGLSDRLCGRALVTGSYAQQLNRAAALILCL